MDNNYFLPYQNAWLNDKALIRVWEKSRRIGATYLQAYEDVTDCVYERLPKNNANIWYAAQTEENAKEYIRYCERYAGLFNVIFASAGVDMGYKSQSFDNWDNWQSDNISTDDTDVIDIKKDVKVFELFFKNGSKITVLSSNPVRFRGAGGKIVLDEFAYHKNPKELWETIAPCTTWGGRICILSTHSEPDSYYNNLIKKIKNGELKNASVHSVTIYDAIEQGIVEKINEETGQQLTEAEFIEIERNKAGTHEAWAREYCCTPMVDISSLAIKGFSDKNIANVQYRPYLYVTDEKGNIDKVENPVYLFCDFNWSQNCWGLGHILDGDFYMFREYCKEMFTIDLIHLVLQELNHQGLIIINGDRSGKKHNSPTNHTDYKVIENALIDAGYPMESDYYNSGKRYRKNVNDFNIWRDESFYSLNYHINDINDRQRLFVNPATCPMFVYACENLKLIPGTSKYKTYTEKQIESNPKLKFMDDIVDAVRYWVGANSKIKKKYISTPPRPLTPLEKWRQQK